MIGIKKQTSWYLERTIKLNIHIKGMKAINTLPKIERAIFAHRITLLMCKVNIKNFSLVEATEMADIARQISNLLSIKMNRIQTVIKNYLI